MAANGSGTPLSDTEVEVQGGCFPYGFLQETCALFKLAWPLALSILFHYLIQPISLMFCGHLGDHELAAASMAISVIYITTVSLGRGLAFGGDTYFSQTYGSTNKMLMGIYLQKGLIFGVFTSIPVWATLLNAESILLLLGQDPDVSKLAQEYVLLFCPGVLAYCWLFLLMRYLLCQNCVKPNMIICILACGANALLHYLLLFQAGMGIRGSAISLMSTYYLVLFMFISYMYCSGIYKETWPGWSWECLEDWGPFGWTAVSSIFMTFLFWLCTEVGTFLCGILGMKELSAFQILFQVEGFAWMIPLGLGGACTARVGQFLGANQPLGAITSIRVSLAITVVISLALALGSYALKHYIPMAFTNSQEVISYTEQLIPILSIFLLLEGFGGTVVGIVRGSGRQTFGAVVVFVSYYLIGLPLGIPLLYLTYLGQAGLWWGYVLGLGVQDISLGVFVLKTNWYDEARKAQVRAGVAEKEELNGNSTSTNQEEPPISERTSLLGDERNIQQAGHYEAIGERTRQSKVKTVMKRLGLLSIFCVVLAGGVLARIYIKVEPHEKWKTLCIPVNESQITTTPEVPLVDSWSPVFMINNLDYYESLSQGQALVALPENVTLPFCNTTSFDDVLSPLYSKWWSHHVGKDMRLE